MAKRALFLTMVLCLIVALMTVTAFATETVTGTCGEGLTWTIDAQGTLTISGTGAMETYAYGSAPWYEHREDITSVVVEDTVTEISDGAFHGFSAVAEMTLPFVGGSVRTTEQIYQYPLGYIFGTDSYDGGVETLQRFYWTQLEELVSNTYYIPGSLSSVTVTGGNILAGAFYNCSGLTNVILPEGIDCIRECAFTHCESLTSVEIPEGVTRIWSSAFSYCAALTEVALPDSLTIVDTNVFAGCASLRQIVIPPDVSRFSTSFVGCETLEKVTFCGDYPKYMTDTFQDLTVTVYYPSENGTWTEDVRTDYGGTVTWVPYEFDTGIIASGTCGETAVWRSNKEGLLTISGEGEISYEGDAPWCGYAADVIEIVVSPYITKIPEGAFSGCGSLEAITLPFVGDEVDMSIGSFGHVFGQKSYVGAQEVVQSTTYYIPTTLRRVEITQRSPSARAFYNCDMLETVTLPAGANIKEYMFANCAGLTSIVSGNFELIGEGAFSGCTKLQEITLPQTLSSIGASAFYQCGSLTSIVIPESVTSIGSAAFAGCSGLEHITIPFVGLEAEPGTQYPFGAIFGTAAYEGGVATEQYILDYWEFTKAYSTYFIPEKLTSVSVTGGDIPVSAFENCDGLTDVTIPVGVVNINADAFSGCGSLTQIVIPENVSSIGSAAFKGCSSLTEITFMGDAPQIKEDAFTGVVAVASYPADSSSWDADVKRNYGGTIVWVMHGETVTVPILRLQYPTLSFEDEVRYNVYYSAEQLEGVVEMGLITFEDKAVDGTIADAVAVVSGYVTDGSVYMVCTEGVSAPRMGDAVYFKVYAKLADGTYAYSPVGGYSAVAYANQMLADESTSSRMQSLVVSMLNYGSEAQKFFGYDTENLMDAFLTEEQKALVEGYDEAMMDPPGTADAGKAGIFVLDSFAFGQCYPTVSFDSAFALNYYFTANLAPDAGMTLYYWDAEDYDSVSTLTMENATGAVAMTDMGSGQYWGQVAGIAAKALDRTVYAVGVYTSGGTTYTTGIIPYSLGRYCEGIAANDASEQQALAQATAVYGYYAKAYFAQ